MSQYFPKPRSCELYLSNHETKVDLKNVAGVDTSKLGKKGWFSKLKILDADKLIPVPVDLSKLNDVVKYNTVKKGVYNPKIKNIENKIPDITTNTNLNAKINVIKREIPSITNLATTTSLNAKINETKNKIPNITNLATTTALTDI